MCMFVCMSKHIYGVSLQVAFNIPLTWTRPPRPAWSLCRIYWIFTKYSISLYKTGFLDFFCKTVFRSCCCYFIFISSLCCCRLVGRRFYFFSSISMWVCMCLCVSAESICVWFRFDCLRNRILKIHNKYVNTHTHTRTYLQYLCLCMYVYVSSVFVFVITFHSTSVFRLFLAFGHRDFNFPLSATSNPQLIRPTPLKLANYSTHAQHTEIIPNKDS